MIGKRAVIEAGVIVSLSIFAFHGRQKKEARKQSTGICQDCGRNVGKGKTIFGHLNHNRLSPDYNLIKKNGRERCKPCETKYHLAHIDTSEVIGLTRRDNLTATFSHLSQLSDEDQAQLANEFPEQLDSLLNRLK